MAMTDDSDFPRLTPPDDRYPAHDGLLRKPEELTDEQFDLLAAAWSEEALAGDRPSVLEETLAGDQLSELEEAMTAIPSRRLRAESFRGVKLLPYDDKWDGRNRLLRQAPATRVIKRTLVVTLLAAAAVVAFIITGPANKSRTTDIPSGALPEAATMSEALIPESYPVRIPDRGQADATAAGRVTEKELPATMRPAALAQPGRRVAASDITEPENTIPAGNITLPGKSVAAGNITEPGRGVAAGAVTDPEKRGFFRETPDQSGTLTVTLSVTPVSPVIIAAARTTDLRTMQMAAIIPAPAQDKAESWIIRGISLLANTLTKEDKNIDGYLIASACVKGLNNALGWEMELEQASNKAGEPVAVNFSSSLLTFSAPVSKNSP